MDVLICRSGFEDALCDEVRHKMRGEVEFSRPVPGIIGVKSGIPISSELIFERRRMPDAGFVADEHLKPITADLVEGMLRAAADSGKAWSLHSFTEGNEESGNLGPRMKGIEKAILRVVREHFPNLFGKYDAASNDLVLQLCLTPKGLFHSCAVCGLQPAAPLRMRQDPHAPSRSYLKLEEAFYLMGRQPCKKETAVDLGAAPGGWTYALIRRGCNVTAVDHGLMNLPPSQPGWGRVRHIQANGITFEPPRELCPVDWLVSDMLVAPGVVMGLLRRWLGGRRMKYFVCNIKIPQQQPYEAVRSLEEFLNQQRNVEYRMKQLYHDRREITVMGLVK